MVRFIDISGLPVLLRDAVSRISSAIVPPEDFISSDDLALQLLIHYDWDETLALYRWHHSRDELVTAIGLSLFQTTQEDCSVCASENLDLHPACGHACTSHLREHLHHEVSDGRHKLRCANHYDCHILHLKSSLDQRDIEPFEENVQKSFLIYSQSHRLCPDDMNTVVILEDGDKDSSSIQCQTCGSTFCFKCGVPHFPATCQDYNKWIALPREVKPCPKCAGRTFKDEGCLHMTCKFRGCFYDYCWKCLKPWSVTHPFYECPYLSEKEMIVLKDAVDKLEELNDKVLKMKYREKRVEGVLDCGEKTCYQSAITLMLRLIEIQKWTRIYLCYNPKLGDDLKDDLESLARCCTSLIGNYPSPEDVEADSPLTVLEVTSDTFRATELLDKFWKKVLEAKRVHSRRVNYTADPVLY